MFSAYFVCCANWWLRGVASPALFASVSGSGAASYEKASVSFGVRPAFAIEA